MFRSYYINNSATRNSNFHFIANHCNGTWNELQLEKLLQFWQSTWLCAYWWSFLKQLELDHELANYREKVLIHAFIKLVQSLVYHENFMQFAAIVHFNVDLQFLL